ncbi:MAG: chemotaxis-specific protein-glutamate methyltransferase CheB [Candidatus Eremiobacteraeota bacterium]|nr:chemotaxis-specific protein-glutamate methyltransferase CheB [Candidatus Eremiobacteraeota bacterium]
MAGVKTKVFLVDDSAFFRRTLESLLGRFEQVEVVGLARNGKEALAKLTNLETDLVIMDINMPVMDGLETLKQIRELELPVRVVVLSGHTRRKVENTVSALLLGAEDFVVKPSKNEAGANEEALISALREIVERPAEARRKRWKSAQRPSPAPRASRPEREWSALVIASSTGGPKVLYQLFETLPRIYQPIFIAQHMPEEFTSALASQLNARGSNLVKEAEHGERIRPNTTYLARGNHHLRVCRQEDHLVVTLDQAARVNHCRPSADVLFRSAARCYGQSCLGLVLTGMGHDGLEGARALSNAGGEILAQDRESCVVWGMPKAVVEAGIARQVELASLAELLSRKLKTKTISESG